MRSSIIRADISPLFVANTLRVPNSGLTSQLRGAVVSIASNIVEGSVRYGLSDYIRLADMACGSKREVEYQLTGARRLEFAKSAAILTWP